MINLDEVRQRLLEFCESRQDREGPYGAYRMKQGRRTDLYSSCDLAIARTISGEDFRETLSDTQRNEWVEHINSFVIKAGRNRGAYSDTYNHSHRHANGTVIGALGPLGGRQPYPVPVYKELDAPEKVEPWMEWVPWQRAWAASHHFWGGAHCFSMSKRCTREWMDAVFAWLDANLDEKAGWWRKGVPHKDRHQGLGGAVHILPIYEHHDHAFPYPEPLIDSVLAMQLPSGSWYDRPGPVDPVSYLDLDALYALIFAGKRAPDYRRGDIAAAAARYADLMEQHYAAESGSILSPGVHPHTVLAFVGCMGLLNQHDPERFPASTPWTDIFSDTRLYRTDLVETLENDE
jgi:hypothetical protein